MVAQWPVFGDSVPKLEHEFLLLWLHFHFFLEILAAKAQKAADHVPSFKLFEIEPKLHLQELNFKLEFWDEDLQNRP